MIVRIGPGLTFDDVVAVSKGAQVAIGPGVEEAMGRARTVVEDAAASGAAVYGISTGIGDLANVKIDPSGAKRLQSDLIRSHSTGVGDPLSVETVRAMMFLKARTFSFGASGVRPLVVEKIAALLNAGIHPIVPSQGSLGASGDLAQLAHLAQPLIGEGQVAYRGRVELAAEALRAEGIEPLVPSFKEGLSLVNGTEMMLGIGILTWVGAERLARSADITGAMTLEACLGTDRAFDPKLIELRKHAGSIAVANNLRRLLEGSEIVASHRESEHLVQDAYSLRCIPQVHGAYRDGLEYVRATLEAELGSAIDNPSVIGDEVISGGNFHGESLALSMDHLALCIAGFGTIAERRIARLVDPSLNNGLPAFLTRDPGRRSGYMIAQYTAAALVSESRTLCFPASADSIPTSAGQEDHVSMGATAARKAATILTNAQRVIAIEALVASQGLDLRAPLEPAQATGGTRSIVREVSPMLEEDRALAPDIAAVTDLLGEGRLIEGAEAGGVFELD